jgi:hypothetical protein
MIRAQLTANAEAASDGAVLVTDLETLWEAFLADAATAGFNIGGGINISDSSVANSATSTTASKDASEVIELATSAALDDIIDTATDHNFVENDVVRFSAHTGGVAIVDGTDYHVIAANLAAQTFQVSATEGGAAIDFATDITAGRVSKVVS